MTATATAPAVIAFTVEIDDMRCIAFAATPAKARWKAVKAYWEAGYGRRGVWPRPTAWRCPRFDNHPTGQRDADRVYSESSL